MDKNKANVPKIRFPGFTSPWEQRKYSNVFTNIPHNTLARSELNYNSGLAKNVHYGDVLIKFGELLDVEKDEIPYITDGAMVNKFRSSKLKNGDVIITDAAEDETVGKCTELVNVGEEIVISGLHTIPCRPILSFASGYLGYFMNSSAYHTQLLRLMQGTKVSSISKSALQDTVIFYPFDIVEQKKISELFQQLNNLITLHQRKLNHLQDKKKGLLQKMFPKSGQCFPELRFPGFTDPWEQRKVGDLGNIITGSTPPTNDLSNYGGEYLFVSPADIQGARYVENTNTTLSEKGFRMSRILKEGSILFVSIGSTIGKVAQTKRLSVTNQQINAIEVNDILDKDFIYSLMETKAKTIKGLAATQAVPIVNKTSFTDVDVYIPENLKEQSQIGKVFKQLDNLITLHQRKLSHLQELKKALLQQMFV